MKNMYTIVSITPKYKPKLAPLKKKKKKKAIYC